MNVSGPVAINWFIFVECLYLHAGVLRKKLDDRVAELQAAVKDSKYV